MSKPLAVTAVVAALALIPSAMGGTNRWTTHVPVGTNVRALVSDPTGATVYAAIDGNGVFKSVDAGAHWVAVNNGLTNRRIVPLAMDHRDPSIVYAASFDGAVFRTSNGAVSWQAFSSTPYKIKSLETDSDRHAIYLSTSFGLYMSKDDPVSWQQGPTYPGRPFAESFSFIALIAGRLFTGGDVHLIVSDDGWNTWRTITTLPHDVKLFSAITGETGTSSIFMAAANGVFRSDDRGENWTLLPSTGLPNPVAVTQLVAPGNNRLFAATTSGVFRFDGGVWKSVGGETLVNAAVNSLTWVPAIAPKLIASTSNGIFAINGGVGGWAASNGGLEAAFIGDVSIDPQHPAVAYATATNGIYKTTDRGETWQLAHTEVGGNVHVQVSPSAPETIYTTSPDKILKSSDAGNTWTPLISTTRTSAIAVAPTDAGTVYAALANGMFRTTDGGANWSPASGGLNTYYAYYNDYSISAMAVDPIKPSTVYAGEWDSLYKTDNGGANWQVDFNAGDVPAIAIDPLNPSSVYIARSGGGVLKSIDGGAHWLSAGLADEHVNSLVVHPADSSAYAGTESGHIYKSTSSTSWIRFDEGLGTSPVFALAIDKTGKTLYAATASGAYEYHDEIARFVRLGGGDSSTVARLLEQLSNANRAGFVIPIAGSANGAFASRFSTDVSLSNALERDQDVMLAWLPATSSTSDLAIFRTTIPASSTGVVLADSIVERLGVSGLGALLVVAVSANGDVAADASIDGFARIFATVPGGAETSRLIQSLRFSSLHPPHNRATATGLRHDSAFRTNIGIVNLDGRPRNFDVTVKGERRTDAFTLNAAPFSLAHVPIPDHDYGLIDVSVSAQDGTSWTFYGSTVENATGSATTVIGVPE